jgi:hypothetical protein
MNMNLINMDSNSDIVQEFQYMSLEISPHYKTVFDLSITGGLAKW